MNAESRFMKRERRSWTGDGLNVGLSLKDWALTHAQQPSRLGNACRAWMTRKGRRLP